MKSKGRNVVDFHNTHPLGRFLNELAIFYSQNTRELLSCVLSEVRLSLVMYCLQEEGKE